MGFTKYRGTELVLVHEELLFSILFLLALAACGPLKYTVASSGKAPGADAKIVARVDKGTAHTKLEISAENLPPPGRVSDGMTVYVAWYRKDSSDKWQRMAGLNPTHQLNRY